MPEKTVNTCFKLKPEIAFYQITKLDPVFFFFQLLVENCVISDEYLKTKIKCRHV